MHSHRHTSLAILTAASSSKMSTFEAPLCGDHAKCSVCHIHTHRHMNLAILIAASSSNISTFEAPLCGDHAKRSVCHVHSLTGR